MKRMQILGSLAVLAMAAICGVELATAGPISEGSSVIKIGQAAPDFTLPNATGNGAATYALHDLKGKTVVLIWDSVQCPVANAYADRINDLVKKYADPSQGKVVILAINSNRGESTGEIKSHAAEVGATHPILKDAHNKVADLYDARVTPHVFLIDGSGAIRYMGAIDDNMKAGRVRSHYLADALDAELAGKTIATTETMPFGCSVKRD